MVKINIVEWFDPYNIDHIRAYRYLEKNGMWEVGFIPDNIEFTDGWQIAILSKLTNAYLKNFSNFMEKNIFQNKTYRAMIRELERLEHMGIYKGNGHHLAQKLSDLLWKEFEGSI